MKHYIIDFENLHEDAFDYIEKTDDEVKVVLVYSEYANKISIDVIKEFNIEFHRVEAANQSADMYIGFYIGQIFNQLTEDDEVIILSNDKGYDGLIKTLQPKIHISRIGYDKMLHPAPAKKDNDVPVEKNEDVIAKVESKTVSETEPVKADMKSLSKRAEAYSLTQRNNLVVQTLSKMGFKSKTIGKIAKQIASFFRSGESVETKTYQYLTKEFGKTAGLKIYNHLAPVL